jgi:hypothetical protein
VSSFKSLAWRRSIYFSTTLALTRRDFFFPDIIILDVWILCSRLPVVMTCTFGPHSQPVRFQPQFPVATSPPVNQRIVSSSFLPRLLFRGRHPYSFQVVDQDRRYPLLKIAASFPSLFLLVYWLYCSINHTSHAFASRTGILSLLNSVQIRKAKFKVVQNSDHGRLTYL